ncbi:MAG: hypothetical protein Q9162_005395 [Coniocarpon cinnabarinum]
MAESVDMAHWKEIEVYEGVYAHLVNLLKFAKPENQRCTRQEVAIKLSVFGFTSPSAPRHRLSVFTSDHKPTVFQREKNVITIVNEISQQALEDLNDKFAAVRDDLPTAFSELALKFTRLIESTGSKVETDAEETRALFICQRSDGMVWTQISDKENIVIGNLSIQFIRRRNANVA